MSKTKKKTVVKVKVPRTRNLIAKALCSGRQFQSRRLSKSAKSTARLLTFIRSEHSWISP